MYGKAKYKFEIHKCVLYSHIQVACKSVARTQLTNHNLIFVKSFTALKLLTTNT